MDPGGRNRARLAPVRFIPRLGLAAGKGDLSAETAIGSIVRRDHLLEEVWPWLLRTLPAASRRMLSSTR